MYTIYFCIFMYVVYIKALFIFISNYLSYLVKTKVAGRKIFYNSTSIRLNIL